MRQTATVIALLAAIVAGAGAEQVQHATERQGRRLWGSKKDWSFANLMYHLNACPEPVHCPGGPPVSVTHPCGCPDCSQPHPDDPAFAHGFCNAHPDGGAGAGANGGAAGADADEASVEANSYNSTGSTQNEMPPSANRIFTPLYYIIGAAVLSVGAAALIMRQRNVNHTDKFLDEANVGGGNSGMRGLGMMAAGAGLAAALGFRKKGSGGSVGSNDLSGSVSRRMRSMEAGDAESAPYYRQDEYDQPAFVNVIPGKKGNTLVMEHPESIEVQGPYRPSTYYAAV